MNTWATRAEAYVLSDAHRAGEDLDRMVEWAAGAATALDVATGGGHVARRLRECGIEVVTADLTPAMRPDVITPAERLPFADSAFDVVACRTAVHHFDDPVAAIGEMARVARDRVLLGDTTFMGDDVERAEVLRDPSHVRNYDEGEWRSFVDSAGLRWAEAVYFEHTFDLRAWLDRTGCTGDDAHTVVRLLGSRVSGDALTLRKIVIKAVKA